MPALPVQVLDIASTQRSVSSNNIPSPICPQTLARFTHHRDTVLSALFRPLTTRALSDTLTLFYPFATTTTTSHALLLPPGQDARDKRP
jgi:hypothetical protein